MNRWLLPVAASVLVVAVVLASWTSLPLFVERQWARSHPRDAFRAGGEWREHSLPKLMASIGRRLRWRWRSSSGPVGLPAPGDKYADALRAIAAWSEQHEADDCVTIVRDARRGGEICVVSR
jgi:hypothetical protein